MKKRYYFPILFIIALFISFSLAFSSFAADSDAEPKLYISSNNLSYSDSLYLAYAISGENIDLNTCDVKMLFWNSPKSVYEKGSEDYTETAVLQEVKGSLTPVVFSDGIAPKDIPDAIYARAYVEIGGKTYYSDVVKYSPLQYLYERLNASISDDQRALYEVLLEYGAMVQAVLGHDTEHPANGDFYSISVSGGTLSDGCTHGLYTEGDSITISCDVPEGKLFSYWKDSEGNKIGYTNTLQLLVPAKNEQYEPVFADSEFTVIFKDIDGTILDTQSVVNGASAIAPALPAKNCIAYSWDKDFSNVTENIEITVIYTEKHNFLDIQCKSCGKYKETDIKSFEIIESVDSVTLKLKDNVPYETIVLPEAYNGKPITAILPADSGDSDPVYLTTLTKLVISKNLKSVGSSAFTFCSSLSTVIIPEDSALETIESNAFAATAITEIVLPEGFTTIKLSAFYSCSELSSVTLPSTLEYIANLAFGGCSKLNEVIFTDPDNWYIENTDTPLTFSDAQSAATQLTSTLKTKILVKK